MFLYSQWELMKIIDEPIKWWQADKRQTAALTDCFSRKSYSALFVYDKKTRWLELSDYIWRGNEYFRYLKFHLYSSYACKLLISKKQNNTISFSQFTPNQNHELLSWIEHDWLLQAWSWIGRNTTTQLLFSSIIAWSSTFYVT